MVIRLWCNQSLCLKDLFKCIDIFIVSEEFPDFLLQSIKMFVAVANDHIKQLNLHYNFGNMPKRVTHGEIHLTSLELGQHSSEKMLQ